MKIVLKLHSMVDLITNSSSEIFIGTSDKSIRVIKEILMSLVELRSQKNKIIHGCADPYWDNKKFSDMFKEPRIVQYDFVAEDCPFYHEYSIISDYSSKERHPVYIECKKKWEIDQKTEHMGKNYMACWQPWYDLIHQSKMKVLKWAFKKNNIPWSYNDIPSEYYFSTESKYAEFNKIALNFIEALEGEYDLVKGNIIVESTSDNSIPYELFDDIEELLGPCCIRKHLG